MSCAIINYGVVGWAATYFLRVHGMRVQDVGLKLGLASAVGVFLSTIVSGVLADRLGGRDVRWYMRIIGIGMLCAVPFGVFALLSHDANLALALYCPAIGLLSCWASPIHAMTQTIAQPRMRGMASAIIAFFFNLGGYGLGPLVVGILNDHFEPHLGRTAIRYSLLILLSGCIAAAAICFATNASVEQDLQQARSAPQC
jgi:MFS family permease